MSKVHIVVDRLEDWAPYYPTDRVVLAHDFLRLSDLCRRKDMVLNLCLNQGYLSPGYYVSLLAVARGAKVMPSVSALNDLANFSHYALFKVDLPRNLESSLAQLPQGDGDTLTAFIFFGQCTVPELRTLARSLFERYRAPILQVRLRKRAHWTIEQIALGRLDELSDTEQTLFAETLDTFCKKVWPRPRKGRTYRYDLAILRNAEEALPPSNEKALKAFVRAGQEIGLDVEVIGPDDFGRLAEFDALFIRETTAVNHHTYRFAKRAENEGLVVIDAPRAILRCTNKVFLTELLEANRIPMPKSRLLFRAEPVCPQMLLDDLGAPLILKVPDGSFSIGVEKVSDTDELSAALERLFTHSAILLAQEFVPTEFDWRIGVLDGRAIYACKYFMARGHWQIYNHAASRNRYGASETFGVHLAPKAVVQTAVRACRLIGNGLFGVDIKERGDVPVVIEINDNPSIDAGIEDAYLGDELYRIIMNDFLRRLDEARR